MAIGIEALNVYGGPAFIDVATLFRERGLEMDRFDNLMMEKKSVGLPCEDAVTNAVNAAKPIVDQLSEADRNSIQMVIAASESGLDFGKALSTYIHDFLDLSRHCRLFEIKQACYGGTAALHLAATHVAAGVSPGGKVLVIATDEARATMRMTYAEPSQATGAVAMLIGDKAQILELDLGANGFYSYEVMDTCRPKPDMETGDPDLSLLSYLDCLEHSFRDYSSKVAETDLQQTFDFLAFHTPFAGMVKGAHRKMMRKFNRLKGKEADADFERRVAPSLRYCVQIGNVYSATLYIALASLIDHAQLDNYYRVGLFSYGSGCSSEFYSGLISPHSRTGLARMEIGKRLNERYELSMTEYDRLLELNQARPFGAKDIDIDRTEFAAIYDRTFADKGLLALKRIVGYHREYDWS